VKKDLHPSRFHAISVSTKERIPCMFDRVISWLYTRKIWGPRCSEFEPECPCCDRWKQHDELFNE
jgi:hypothetical protein